MNRKLSDSIKPECGVRQGDPLSPYLFVIAMEKLSQIIGVAVETKEWKEIKVCQGGPSISHSFFAEDLILFGKATTQQAAIMKKCMDIFCPISGQKVNFGKSCVFVSPNIPRSEARRLAAVCDSLLTENIGRYLGVPIVHERVSKHTYGYLIDKVSDRLSA